MTTARIHHPACPSRFGGLCTGCPPTDRLTSVTSMRFECPTCHEWFMVAGETAEVAESARADWTCPNCDSACGCHPDYHDLGVHAPTQTPGPRLGEERGPGTDADPDRLSPRPVRQAGSAVAARHPLSRLLSGIPAWVRRRAIHT